MGQLTAQRKKTSRKDEKDPGRKKNREGWSPMSWTPAPAGGRLYGMGVEKQRGRKKEERA